MPAPGHILVVCTANICRSPMAEGLLQHALAAEAPPLSGLKVVSAGIAARPGEPVSAHSVAALRKVGVDIGGHRARPLTQELLDGALAVFCMTRSHCTSIEVRGAPAPMRLHLLRAFAGGVSSAEIADPFGDSLQQYEHSRDEMVEAIPGLLAYLRSIVPPAS